MKNKTVKVKFKRSKQQVNIKMPIYVYLGMFIDYSNMVNIKFL